MTTSAKTITIGGVSSTSKVDAMGKTENGKTGKSEIAQNLPGSPTTAARRRVTLRDVATAAGVSLKTASNVINGTGRMTDATRAKSKPSSSRPDTGSTSPRATSTGTAPASSRLLCRR